MGAFLECLERRDCPATISIANAAVDEGTSAATIAEFVVSLSEPSSSVVAVNWKTVDGSATVADNDYRTALGTIRFSPGQTSRVISVSVFADSKVEPNETFGIQLSDPVGATLVNRTATGTIRNDDVAQDVVPKISVGDVRLPERNSGRTDAFFTVTLSAPTNVPVTVTYATANGTATVADTDYVPTTSNLTFAPGETSKTVGMGVLGDARVESDETFLLVLSNPINATLNKATGMATIVNDDVRPPPPPAVSVTGGSVVEGKSGDGATVNFTITLTGVASSVVTVAYETLDGTARLADNDYRKAKGTLAFQPGETTKTIAVAVIGDAKPESDESFSLALTSVTGASIDRSARSAIATAVDDDTPPVISLANASLIEGNFGEQPATFVITLSRPWIDVVTVSYATRDGSATVIDADYVANTGMLTFAPGEISKTVDVTVNGDIKSESNETFALVLSSPMNAILGKAEGVGQIRNDDAVAWTIMVYMTGENLNTFAFQDINEMEKALTGMPGGVNIVVSWDQPKVGVGTAYATGGGAQAAWRTYGRSVLTPDADSSRIASTFDISFGERNTGAAATLTDFVQWSVQNAPAQHYLLQMWGHGGGLMGSQFDSESNGDSMEISEIASALAAPGVPAIDLISYDNCLMAMAEVGYAMSQKGTGLYVASQELVNGTGQDYTTAYNALKAPANPFAVSAGQIAASMVASYGIQYQNDPTDDTFSAANTSGYAALASALRQFVTNSLTLTAADRTALLTAAKNCVGYDVDSFRDLGSFMANVSSTSTLPAALRFAADGVKQAITAMITTKTADHRRSSGVSIYLPSTSGDSYLSTYPTTAAAFCQATNWNTFAKWLATGSRSAAAAQSPGIVPRPRLPAGARAAPVPAARPSDWAHFAVGSQPATGDSTPASRKAAQRAFAGLV